MIVNLNDHRKEKQYREFYHQHGNLELARDTVYIHIDSKKSIDIHKTYTQQWIKLLSEIANNKNL